MSADPPRGTNPDNVPITGDDAVNDSPAVDLLATLHDSQQAITAAHTEDALHRDLPEYAEVLRVNFALGTMTAEESARVINSAYDEAVHFCPNACDVPNGSGGKEFVNLLSQYLLVFGNADTYQGQALKVAMLFQTRIKDKPSR